MFVTLYWRVQPRLPGRTLIQSSISEHCIGTTRNRMAPVIRWRFWMCSIIRASHFQTLITVTRNNVKGKRMKQAGFAKSGVHATWQFIRACVVWQKQVGRNIVASVSHCEVISFDRSQWRVVCRAAITFQVPTTASRDSKGKRHATKIGKQK